MIRRARTRTRGRRRTGPRAAPAGNRTPPQTHAQATGHDTIVFIVLHILVVASINTALFFFVQVVLRVQLVKYVLNLPLELLIGLVHQILEYIRHTDRFSLFSQLSSRED